MLQIQAVRVLDPRSARRSGAKSLALYYGASCCAQLITWAINEHHYTQVFNYPPIGFLFYDVLERTLIVFRVPDKTLRAHPVHV